MRLSKVPPNPDYSWLGEVPKDWQIVRFRNVFSESQEKIEGTPVGNMLSVSGYRGIEVKDYDDENRRRLDEELVGYRIVRVGQLVVNTMWLNYAGLGVSEFEGHVSPAYRAYNFKIKMDKRFAHHLLRSNTYVKGYTRYLTGIRPNSLQMSRDDLMSFPVLIPPLPEQTAIAAFLDRETAKIDGLIEQQKRLIELLKEKRQATISHTVTKGLNPNAKMKDTGIEWLGEVPEHWEVVPLKWLASCQSGESRPTEKISLEIDEINSVPTIGGNGVMGYTDVSNTSHSVLAVGRVGALCGNVHVVNEPAWITDNALLLSGFSKRIDLLYLADFLIMRDLNSMASKTAQPLITGRMLVDQRIALPPISEQVAISATIREKSREFNQLIITTEIAMSLLQERRSALISAAVTGKIDVRSSTQ